MSFNISIDSHIVIQLYNHKSSYLAKFSQFCFYLKTEGMSRIELNPQVTESYELCSNTELSNDELSCIHTPDLPHLLL